MDIKSPTGFKVNSEPSRKGLPAVQQGLAERLICLHDEIKGDDGLNELARIAVALYDERSDMLKTFVHSSDGESPLDHSAAKLSDMPTLQQLAWTGARRIINDLEKAAEAGQPHINRLVACGYLASYTVPIRAKGKFFGFLFLNSFNKDFFTPKAIHRLRPYVELIAHIVMRELDTVRMMNAAVRVIRQVSAVRDEETGAHLARMARYSALIARKLAAELGLSDEFIEYLFQFAPIHDVGKISVPDRILFKPGKLDPDEFEIMKGHVQRGLEIVDMMARDFGIEALAHFSVLRNVIAYHHEALDGSGYPHRLTGDHIPIEARIAAVADVFDALTSNRPYKTAWTNQEAFDLLQSQAGTKFDPDCVRVLLENAREVEEIQARFEESVYD
jgi:HD-GYP domain-containing protein (c-di-GMP phosphodiesterase class II)